MLPQDFKDISEVSYLLGHLLDFYHHIVYIDLNTLTQLWFKHLSHHLLIGGSRAFQAKGHHLIVGVTKAVFS